MPEETITFEYIREIQRAEQRNTDLTKLPEDFYEKVKDYLEQKNKLLKKKKDKTTSIELKNIKMLLEDIYNRRETKIVNQAILSVRTGLLPQNLTEQEKEFFEAIVDNLKNQRNLVLEKLFKKREEIESEYLEFLEDIQEFVGVDLKVYGPYNKGNKALIPKDNAQLFINAGKAKISEEGEK